MWFVWLVGDIAGLDPDLILEYIALLWYPIVCFLVFPLVILILLYASALFLTVYKWKNQLHEAYHHNFWDGARQTLAVFWEAQASVWHGKKRFISDLREIDFKIWPVCVLNHIFHFATMSDMHFISDIVAK